LLRMRRSADLVFGISQLLGSNLRGETVAKRRRMSMACSNRLSAAADRSIRRPLTASLSAPVEEGLTRTIRGLIISKNSL
ncbi:MAG: hypothetical protein KJ070_14325, partial [Verrucomicrobia bacterium]|nr:hypothetical protein [Verrucomicrobiota bacterium]